MYFPTLAHGQLTRFAMTPTQTRRLRVNAVPAAGTRWLLDTLNRAGRPFGTRVAQTPQHYLLLQWQ